MKKVFPIEIEEHLHRQLKHAAIDAGLTLHAFVIKVLRDRVMSDGRAARASKGHNHGHYE